jgi:hypothetical protein
MRRWQGLAAAAMLLAGCASTTRTAQMGPLPNQERLVTLIVTEDRAVVRAECRNVAAAGPILGCSIWRPALVDGTPIRLIKIVRFTDAVPSALALEIDAHELCHAIAALQPMDDPCHRDNGGGVEAQAAATAAAPRSR